MTFAPAPIADFRATNKTDPAVLTLHGFGLFGPNGPLPLHLTEYARERSRVGDTTFSRFADLFHHRLISLFYRAWADSQPTVQFDRPSEDRFALYFGALAGLALESSADTSEIPHHARLQYTGQFAIQSHPPGGLEAILEEYFGVPVKIEEFIGHWVDLPESCMCRLGASPQTGTLGTNLTVGEKIWQCQDRFRIVMGPMGASDYQRMLPGSESLDRMMELVRNFTGDELHWDVRLIIKKEETEPVKLGGHTRLGLTTWLASRTLDEDPGNLVFEPQRNSSGGYP
jgi:type VI secretion system protein ImpH